MWGWEAGARPANQSVVGAPLAAWCLAMRMLHVRQGRELMQDVGKGRHACFLPLRNHPKYLAPAPVPPACPQATMPTWERRCR